MIKFVNYIFVSTFSIDDIAKLIEVELDIHLEKMIGDAQGERYERKENNSKVVVVQSNYWGDRLDGDGDVNNPENYHLPEHMNIPSTILVRETTEGCDYIEALMGANFCKPARKNYRSEELGRVISEDIYPN